MQEQKFYIRYPLRQSKMKPGYMQLFYFILGLVWLIAAVYLYIYNSSNKLILPLIYVIIGLAIEVLAFFYPRLFLGKYVKLSDNGIESLLPGNEKITVKWHQIDHINIQDKVLEIYTKHERSIKLSLQSMYDVEWKKLRKVLKSIDKENEKIKISN